MTNLREARATAGGLAFIDSVGSSGGFPGPDEERLPDGR